MACIAGAEDPGVRAVVIAGLALRSADLELVREVDRIRDVAKPLALVQAAADQFGSLDEVRAALEGAAGPRRLAVVDGATHLFTEALPALQREAEAAIRWALAGGEPGAPA